MKIKIKCRSTKNVDIGQNGPCVVVTWGGLKGGHFSLLPLELKRHGLELPSGLTFVDVSALSLPMKRKVLEDATKESDAVSMAEAVLSSGGAAPPWLVQRGWARRAYCKLGNAHGRSWQLMAETWLDSTFVTMLSTAWFSRLPCKVKRWLARRRPGKLAQMRLRTADSWTLGGGRGGDELTTCERQGVEVAPHRRFCRDLRARWRLGDSRGGVLQRDSAMST